MKLIDYWGLMVIPSGALITDRTAWAKLVGQVDDRLIITSKIIHLHEPRGGGDVFPFVITASGNEYDLRGIPREKTTEEWLALLRRVLAGEKIY